MSCETRPICLAILSMLTTDSRGSKKTPLDADGCRGLQVAVADRSPITKGQGSRPPRRCRGGAGRGEGNCLPGVGGGSVGGSGSLAGGESNRVRMHRAVTKIAASPTLHNFLVPATGMFSLPLSLSSFFPVIIFIRGGNLHSSCTFVTSVTTTRR